MDELINIEIKNHTDKNGDFPSLSQFTSSVFEIITEPKTNKKCDILFYRIFLIYDFRDLGELNIINFRKVIDLYFFEYEKLKEKVYSSMEVNKEHFAIENDEIAVLLADGYINHPKQISKYDISSCLCTHSNIVYHFIIQNKSEYDKKRCWVGSSCIKNFMVNYNPKMGENLRELNLKIKHKKEGHICRYCEEGLGYLKSYYCEEGFCDASCKEKFNYTIPFGKHKGRNLYKFMDTPKGYDYVLWAKNKYLYENYFKYFPIFRKIIMDFDLELSEE